MNWLLLDSPLNYVARGAQGRKGLFEEVGHGFHGIFAGSHMFLAPRWTMLEKVLIDFASWCWPYLAAEPSRVGVDVVTPLVSL
jgi:hypothetical protein